jgi:hypothetical protein
VLSTLWVPVGPKPQFKTASPIATILTKGKHMTIPIRGTQTFVDLLTGESEGDECMLASAQECWFLAFLVVLQMFNILGLGKALHARACSS